MSVKTSLNSFFKMAVVPVILVSMVSCTANPTNKSGGETTPKPTTNTTNDSTIREAFSAYEKRNFSAAYEAYEQATGSNSAGTQRLAHLGKALVHLSTDAQWRDSNKAALSLQAAESVDGSANVETNMLINALSSLIGIEADIAALNQRLSNSSFEIDKLEDEREALVSEQQRLNEALEKLKDLTIGN